MGDQFSKEKCIHPTIMAWWREREKVAAGREGGQKGGKEGGREKERQRGKNRKREGGREGERGKKRGRGREEEREEEREREGGRKGRRGKGEEGHHLFVEDNQPPQCAHYQESHLVSLNEWTLII